jgi:hypothetical protein
MIAFVVKDPVLSVMWTLGLSVIVFSTVILWKPYSDVENQRFVRTAHGVLVTQNVSSGLVARFPLSRHVSWLFAVVSFVAVGHVAAR